MKKLMIAACAIALAAVTQAATAKWTASNVYEMGTTTKVAAYYAYFIQTADYAYADAVTALSKADTSFLSNATEGANGVGKAAGVYNISGWGSFGNEETIEGYVVFINAGTLADATYAYITSTASSKTGKTGQAASLAFGSQAGMATDSNWYALGSAPVPEPTSGLLMLIGLGAMALRRRRA